MGSDRGDRVKRYVVTGASRGIGRAVALRLLAVGHRVVASSRDEEALESLRSASPREVEILAGDVREPDRRDALLAMCKDGVDGAVFCAGIARHEPVGKVREEALRETFETNFFAPALEALALMPCLNEGGSYTFVSSTLAQRPAPTTASYAASKGALEAWMRGLALELAPSIRVNAVAPGIVDTAMTRALRLEENESVSPSRRLEREEAQMTEMASLHPLGRLGSVEEVAALIVGVAENQWMTGSVVTLDGGLSLA